MKTMNNNYGDFMGNAMFPEAMQLFNNSQSIFESSGDEAGALEAVSKLISVHIAQGESSQKIPHAFCMVVHRFVFNGFSWLEGFQGHPRDHTKTSLLIFTGFGFTRHQKLNISTFFEFTSA